MIQAGNTQLIKICKHCAIYAHETKKIIDIGNTAVRMTCISPAIHAQGAKHINTGDKFKRCTQYRNEQKLYRLVKNKCKGYVHNVKNIHML